MSTSGTSHIHRFDTAKFILIWLIIMCHACCSYLPFPLSNQWRNGLRFVLLFFSMPLFAFISGWFIHPGKIPWSRLLSLLWLCFLFNMLGNVVAIQRGYRHTIFCVAPVMWYLWVLATCRLCIPKMYKIPGWLVLSFSISWVVCFIPQNCGTHFLGRLTGFLPFFSLGSWIAHSSKAEKFRLWLTSPSSIGFSLVLAIVLLCSVTVQFLAGYLECHASVILVNIRHESFGGGCKALVLRVLFQFLICILGVAFLKILPTFETLFSKLGRKTLGVYLLHIYILHLAGACIFHVYYFKSFPAQFCFMLMAAMFCVILFLPIINKILMRISMIPISLMKIFCPRHCDE